MADRFSYWGLAEVLHFIFFPFEKQYCMTDASITKYFNVMENWYSNVTWVDLIQDNSYKVTVNFHFCNWQLIVYFQAWYVLSTREPIFKKNYWFSLILGFRNIGFKTKWAWLVQVKGILDMKNNNFSVCWSTFFFLISHLSEESFFLWERNYLGWTYTLWSRGNLNHLLPLSV